MANTRRRGPLTIVLGKVSAGFQLFARRRGQADLGNHFFMGVSLLSRMGVGLVVFVLLARELGPQQFGLVCAILSYATLASLVTDFGFTAKTLRDIAAMPERGADILSVSLNVKAILVASVLCIGAIIVACLRMDSASKVAALMLGAGVVLSSFGDLSLIAFRALGRFSGETWVTVWTSLLYLLLMGPIVLLGGSIVWVAAGYLTSRMVYTASAFRSAERLFPRSKIRLRPLRDSVSAMHTASFWAVDAGLGCLNNQIDTLLVVHTMGLGPAGVYQSGARFVQAAVALAGVLINVHIPSLAARGRRSSLTSAELVMAVEFLVMGFIFAITFWQGGWFITLLLLGPQYSAVNSLWLGFGIFVFGRYVTAAIGVALAAFAAPEIRVAGQVAGITVVFVAFWTCSGLTLGSVPWVMAASTLVTTLFYIFGRIWLGKPRNGVSASDEAQYTQGAFPCRQVDP